MRLLRSLTLSRYMAAFAVIALCLRALVPVGFMPVWDQANDGAFAVVICTSSGPVQLPPDGSDDFDQPVHGKAATCPYHVVTSDVLTPDLSAKVQTVAWPALHYSVLRNQVTVLHRGGLPKPARGPPQHQTT